MKSCLIQKSMASSRDTFVPHKNLSTVVRTKMYIVGFKCTEKVNEISVCTDGSITHPPHAKRNIWPPLFQNGWRFKTYIFWVLIQMCAKGKPGSVLTLFTRIPWANLQLISMNLLLRNVSLWKEKSSVMYAVSSRHNSTAHTAQPCKLLCIYCLAEGWRTYYHKQS